MNRRIEIILISKNASFPVNILFDRGNKMRAYRPTDTSFRRLRAFMNLMSAEYDNVTITMEEKYLGVNFLLPEDYITGKLSLEDITR